MRGTSKQSQKSRGEYVPDGVARARYFEPKASLRRVSFWEVGSCVEGIVAEGDHRGRKLGFPTANVPIGPDVDLADGVYSGVVELEDGTRHPAAISVGRRPQYYETGERLVEAYLLDFERDLYGERIRVELGTLLRDQRSYRTENELVRQIEADVEAIRALER